MVENSEKLREFLTCLLSDMRVHRDDIIERSNNQKGRARNRTRRYSAAMKKFIRQTETALSESGAGETSVEFDVWWREKGHKYLPDKDEPPQHAYVAERAWEAAIAAADRAASGGQQDDIPLCGNHAEWWFCERNHLLNPNEPCVVCAMLAAPAAPELSEEQVDVLLAHLRAYERPDVGRDRKIVTDWHNALLRASQAEL